MGLAERGDDPPEELSGGEQQRVAACAALAHAPALLLADEPAGELDARTARIVYRLLGTLVAGRGTTLVVVSHDEAATELADRVVHVRDGRISSETLRSGGPKLVIGRGGWVRLPETAREEARIADRAGWSAERGRVTLSGDDDSPAPPLAAVSEARPDGPIVCALRGIAKGYGTGRRAHRVLDGFDASFARGRLVAVEGRSGSGKTTLLHLIAGLERPDAGSVVVAGADLAGLDREALAAHRRDHVGWVGRSPGSSRSRRRARTSCSHSRSTLEAGVASTTPTRTPGSSASDWATARSAPLTASRPASDSASRSPARSPANPTSSCSTSRPRVSTRKAPRSSPTSSSARRGSRTQP